MLNKIIGFKDQVIGKLGPVLGYAVLIIGGLAALALLGFLFRALVGVIIGLAVGAAVLFGAYKLYEMLSTKKSA
jgi:hypothetical protein